MSAQSLSRVVSRALRAPCTRVLSTSRSRSAVTPLTMPALSPTMTEGGIAAWKKQEGEAFSAGDVLLEIETDKATMDVEAQDDGILGKIVLQDGSKNVTVGSIIAMLAEEGDDLASIEVPAQEAASSSSSPKEAAPKEEPAPSSLPPPPAATKPSPEKSASHGHVKITHSRVLFPSVSRILTENGISDATKIKGTGIRGMLTKGDVLAHLGLASSPWGTAKSQKPTSSSPAAPPTEPKKVEKVYDAATVKALLLSGLVKATKPAAATQAEAVPTFDDIVGPYVPSSTQSPAAAPSTPAPTSQPSFLNGLI